MSHCTWKITKMKNPTPTVFVLFDDLFRFGKILVWVVSSPKLGFNKCPFIEH